MGRSFTPTHAAGKCSINDRFLYTNDLPIEVADFRLRDRNKSRTTFNVHKRCV